MVPAVVAIGETVADVALPGGVAAVWVVNSSEGLGDSPNAPDVVVSAGPAASIDPQVGERLRPGDACTVPVLDANQHLLQLSAIGSGPGAQISFELIESCP